MSKMEINNHSDEILKEAVKSYTLRWLSELEENEEFTPSERLENKMNEIFNSTSNLNNLNLRKRHLKKILVFVAVLIILISALSVSAVREAIKQFFIEKFSTHDTVSLSKAEETTRYVYIPPKIEEIYMLQNLSPDYEIIEHSVADANIFTLYLNSDRQIVFEQYTQKFYKENINNKNAITTSETISGTDYYITYIKESKEYKIVWEYNGYIFSLTGGLSKEKMIELCETIDISWFCDTLHI